jgi:hypothetical protein
MRFMLAGLAAMSTPAAGQISKADAAFARAHRRHPLPDTLTWETGDAAHGRAHWLVIDRLGAVRGEAAGLGDLNLVPSPPRLEFGVRSVGNRVNVVLPGSNADRVGLKAGDAIVRLNGELVHVTIDVEEIFQGIRTLLKWAAADNDRTMLFGAELHVNLAG